MSTKKNTIRTTQIILSIFSILLLSSCWTETTTIDNTIVNTNEVNNIDRNLEIASLQPEYKAELYWKIKQIEWNMFTISEIDTSKDPTAEMEQKEKQAYMQSLSEADRTALKDQIQSAILWDIKIMIPVWIPMIKKELVWDEKQDLEATLEDLKTWDIISIWYNEEITDRKVAKYVKRSLRK